MAQTLPTTTGAEEIHWDLSDLYSSPEDPAIERDLAEALEFAREFESTYKGRTRTLSPAEALRVMQEETDRGWHDPKLMKLFTRLRLDAVREAAERNAAQGQDVHVMLESLGNLRSSLLRY